MWMSFANPYDWRRIWSYIGVRSTGRCQLDGSGVVELVDAPIDGSKYMVRREQELARDVSAFLAVILKLLSLVAGGITVYGVYRFRSGSVSSLASGFSNFFTWVYLVGGLLFALVLFALGHIFTMLISVFDRQELAALGILADVASAQSADTREPLARPGWQRSQWPSDMPTVGNSSAAPSQSHVVQNSETGIPQVPITEAADPSSEGAAQRTGRTSPGSKRSFWEAMTKERHLFAKDED